MRFIKLIVISFVLLFVLASIMGALLPAHVLVSRAVNIAAHPDSIKGMISDIQQWEHWVEGMNDSSVRIQSATNAQMGKTHVTILSVSDTAIVSEWKGQSGPPQTSTIRIYPQPQRGVSIVQWQFEQHLRWYPWERIGSIMNDKIMGPMMEKNLEKLRNYLEQPAPVQVH